MKFLHILPLRNCKGGNPLVLWVVDFSISMWSWWEETLNCPMLALTSFGRDVLRYPWWSTNPSYEVQRKNLHYIWSFVENSLGAVQVWAVWCRQSFSPMICFLMLSLYCAPRLWLGGALVVTMVLESLGWCQLVGCIANSHLCTWTYQYLVSVASLYVV